MSKSQPYYHELLEKLTPEDFDVHNSALDEGFWQLNKEPKSKKFQQLSAEEKIQWLDRHILLYMNSKN